MKKKKYALLLLMTVAMVFFTSCGDTKGGGDEPSIPDEKYELPDSCSDNNHPHAIDLGLPSGTKWACCNIGASSPDGYGNYYAWGETAPKDVYNWGTYKWGDDTKELTKYCTWSNWGHNGFVDNKTELDPMDDAAYVNWGSSWRMPSFAQIQELVNNCTWRWTQRNGVEGQLLTSKINGASLFLPAAGYYYGSSLKRTGPYYGFYWSRTLHTGSPGYALNIIYQSSVGGNSCWQEFHDRFYGQSVRAVRVP